MMFDVGWQELLLILLVALIIFGPERMVDLARTAGKALREFRKITGELSSGLTDVLKEEPSRREASQFSPTTNPPAEAAPPIVSTPLVAPPPDPLPPDACDAAEPTMPNFPVEPELAAGEPALQESPTPA